MTFDVIVIGAGPGGYVAAIRAAQLGLKAAVIEREHLGGICLNWGCIPTKALLRSAEVFDLMRHAGDYGLVAENVRFDAEKVIERSRGVAARLSRGVEGLLKKNNVTVIWGEARVTAPNRVSVSETSPAANRPAGRRPDGVLGPGDYSASHIIVATGARPRALESLAPFGERVWSYFEAMIPKRIPNDLLVVGAGAIGLEFASFYGDLGSNVVLTEILPQILPAEDEEIAKFARAEFQRRGIVVRTGATVRGVKQAPDGRVLAIVQCRERSEEITADAIIVAAGVQGNIEGLGLQEVGVAIERDCIAVDSHGRTNVPGVYAIGDVAGPPMLAHKAEHEGVLCVEAICGLAVQPLDRLRIPSCTYSRPQIASVGLTETKAKAAGYEIRVGRFPFAGNGKAIALGEDKGMAKTIFDASTGRMLGAHMVGLRSQS